MKNKNILVLLSIIAFSFAACQKEADTAYPSSDNLSSQKGGTGSGNASIGAPPSTFTQKVLLENITGASYGKCPDNDYRMGAVQSQYPNQVISASFHLGDAMQGTATNELLNFLNGGSSPNIPAVAMNRIIISSKMFNDPDTWTSNINTALSTATNCGLAIQSTVQNHLARVNVHAGFNTSFNGNYKMCVYLTENNVKGTGSGYNQANNYNNTPSSPFYNMGNPILNYTHNYVVRQILSPLSGYTIPSTYQVSGGHMVKALNFDVPAPLKIADAYIIAFVYNTSNLQILNVQTAKLTTTKSWD